MGNWLLLLYRVTIDPAQQEGSQLWLAPEQQHYLRRVLRLQKGDRFLAMDGRGQCWLAQLQEQGALLLETFSESRELPVPVTLIVALPKGNGFEEIVRSGTELGAAAFIPAISQRTLLKPSENKLARWRKIAAEAAEQSERQIIPTVVEPMPLPAAIAALGNEGGDCYICLARRAATPLLTYLQERPPGPTAIATGPEGGWSEREIEQAIAAGFRPTSLGRRILRAVTAPLAALSLIAAASEGGVRIKE